MKTFSHEAVLQAPATAINLADWIFTIDYEAPVVGKITRMLSANDFWLKRHLVEETGGFAHDIERKLAEPGI